MIQLSLKIGNLRVNKSSLYEQFAIKSPTIKTKNNREFYFHKIYKKNLFKTLPIQMNALSSIVCKWEITNIKINNKYIINNKV